MCIPHLVEIDSGTFVVLRREPAIHGKQATLKLLDRCWRHFRPAGPKAEKIIQKGFGLKTL